MDMKDIRERLALLPYTYADFVGFTMRCIEQEYGVKEAIDNQFRVKPDSDTNDITKVVVDFLGLGEPIELVDDDEEMLVGASSMAGGRARAAY